MFAEERRDLELVDGPPEPDDGARELLSPFSSETEFRCRAIVSEK
jgi:hypothetical protein